MPQALSLELLASGTQTASGSGNAVDITVTDDPEVTAPRRALRVTVDVTVFVPVDSDPTPSIVYTIETRASTSAPWRAAGSVSTENAGVYMLAVGGLDKFVRVTWAFTNMTSATFSAAGVAHVTYCDPADITALAVPEHSIEEIDGSQRANACISVSDTATGYLNSAYVLPITAWDDDLRMYAAQMAAALIFRRRGADPAGPDKMVFDAETAAIKWLDRIANGRLKPPGIIDSTPDIWEGGSVVVSGRSRGW